MAVLSPPGALPLLVVALARRRWLWAAAVALATTAQTASIVVAIHRAGHVAAGKNGAEGFAVILWMVLLVTAWVFPTTIDGRDEARALWPGVTERAQALSARYALLAYFGSLAGVVLLALVLRAAGVHLSLAVGVFVVDALLLGSLAPLILSGRLGRRDLGLRETRLGASTGLAVASLIAYLGLTIAWTLLVIHPATTSQTFSKQLDIPAHPGTVAVMLDVFALAVCGPVCEEIFFRGFLFRALRNRLSLWPAALIAGSLFGLAHISSGYPLNTIPIKMLFGVLMCLLYERTGSLLPGIALHSFVDGSIADALFAGNIAIAFGLAGLALVGVGMRMLVTASRSRYPPPPWRLEPEDRPLADSEPVDPGAPWPPYLRDD